MSKHGDRYNSPLTCNNAYIGLPSPEGEKSKERGLVILYSNRKIVREEKESDAQNSHVFLGDHYDYSPW